MKDNKSGKLTLIVVIAAVVAALTTVAVLFLRARAKRQAMLGRNAAFDYDLDDCDCYDDCDYCQDEDPEEPAEESETQAQ